MERIVLVQLTDIHVGSIRNGFYKTTLRGGLNGHDALLLARLQEALLDIPIELNMGADEQLHVVVTGDLTCSGLQTDFVLAHTYLLGQIISDYLAADVTGLQIAADRFWTVPGNHDHWAGKYHWPQPAHDPSLIGLTLEQTPWCHTLHSPNRVLLLDLFGIDSNSGLAGRAYNDTACGVLSNDELFHPHRGLDQLLQASEATRQALPKGVCQVRGVLCHHAFSNNNNARQTRPQGPVSRGRLSRYWRRVFEHFFGKNPDPLDPSSVTELVKLAHKYDVRAVLTGHTHRFHAERFPPRMRAKPGAPFVWELRSSTALQGPARDCEQGFYVHEISLAGKPPTPVWRYRPYLYSLNRFNPGAWTIAD